MTLANKLTFLRLALIPFFMAALAFPILWCRILAFLIFIGASLTDLYDAVRRRAYDLSTFHDAQPEAIAVRVTKPALAAEQLMLQSELEREIGPDTEFSGTLLRKVRESQGVELGEIASRSKIARMHLSAIEEELYDELPAPVYVRGFLTELAKYLRLDPSQVHKTYLRRMREAMAASGKAGH